MKLMAIAWTILAALWYGWTLDERVEIMFNPTTDGPVRYAEKIPELRSSAGGAGSVNVCAMAISTAPGTTSTVLTPCPPTSGNQRP